MAVSISYDDAAFAHTINQLNARGTSQQRAAAEAVGSLATSLQQTIDNQFKGSINLPDLRRERIEAAGEPSPERLTEWLDTKFYGQTSAFLRRLTILHSLPDLAGAAHDENSYVAIRRQRLGGRIAANEAVALASYFDVPTPALRFFWLGLYDEVEDQVKALSLLSYDWTALSVSYGAWLTAKMAG